MRGFIFSLLGFVQSILTDFSDNTSQHLDRLDYSRKIISIHSSCHSTVKHLFDYTSSRWTHFKGITQFQCQTDVLMHMFQREFRQENPYFYSRRFTIKIKIFRSAIRNGCNHIIKN